MFTFDSFFDHLGNLDWLGVIVGTVATVALGWVWYGPLFGKPWSKAVGIPYSSSPPVQKVVQTIVYCFVFNVGVSFFALDDFEHAIVAGIMFGFLFIGMALYSGSVWAKQSYRAYTFDFTYWVVAVAVATYVQGLFL